jgi:high-affinity nickel-transport protein
VLSKIWGSKRSWGAYFGFVALLHIVGFAGLVSIARDYPAFWGLGLLAYTFGLRHAFDVDHIAAIDNTVRKLIQQEKNPLGVGFFFSLGHSSVVFLMVLAIGFSIQWIQAEMPQMQEIGGLIGTTVSGGFLVLIGLVNLIILIHLVQVFRQMRSGRHNNEELEKLLNARGLLSRLFRPLFKLITRSWHVYPLGFLFGLGFDTATEIGLLAISATAVKSSVSIFGILSLPILFASGMSLLDTADGMFMAKAYRWAFSNPIRKIYYNVTVTTLSVMAALLIGVVELMQALVAKWKMQAPFLVWIQNLDFGDLGYMLAGLFVLAWVVSITVWKVMKVEERFSM